MDRKCKECGKVGIKANGLCSACYQRWYRANFGVKKGDIEEGKGEVVERVHRMLREYGIKCWYEGGVVYVEVGGKVEEG